MLFHQEWFFLPVVPRGAAELKTNLPAVGVADGTRVTAAIEGPEGAPVRSIINIPGWFLVADSTAGDVSPTIATLDAGRLQAIFPLVDTLRPDQPRPGLADTFVWVLTTGDGADLRVRRVVLNGPQLLNP